MQPNSKAIISRMVEQQIGKQKKFREFALKEVNKKVKTNIKFMVILKNFIIKYKYQN